LLLKHTLVSMTSLSLSHIRVSVFSEFPLLAKKQKLSLVCEWHQTWNVREIAHVPSSTGYIRCQFGAD
jgi:hypothetical protein